MGAQREIIAAVVALVKTVQGIGKVEDRVGGVATWVTAPRVRQSFWEVDIESIEEADVTAHGMFAEGSHVTVEGWMPFDYKLNTAATWRDQVDAIRDLLRGNRTLKGLADFGTGLPQTVEQNLNTFPSGDRGDIVCHHTKITWVVDRSIHYESA